MIIIAAKKEKNRQFYLFAILLMAFSLVLMSFTEHSLVLMFVCIFLYFTAFNFLEASLPAFISMLAPAGAKGSAMGIYSTYQFLGAFFGGILGGVSYKLLGNSGLFLFLACLMLVWFFISWGLHNPSKIRTHTLTAKIKNKAHATQLTNQLINIDGVIEVVIIIEEQTVYIKVNNKIFSLKTAQQILA
jgi:MFS family permease